MKKVFLCALLGLGFMNFSFGQINANSEWISVKKYDESKIVESFHLSGDEAIEFDVVAYIKENDDVERLIIKGRFSNNYSSRTINFDSALYDEESGEEICMDLEAKLIPFLGVYGSAKRGKAGVDLKRIINDTSAERAGLLAKDDIIGYDGKEIKNFRELKKAVLATEIGTEVELNMIGEDGSYTKTAKIGSRGVEIETYKYCLEAEIEETVLRNDSKGSFIAFPNPTNSSTQVSFESNSTEEVTFSVTDINGKLIHKQVIEKFDGKLNLDFSFDGNPVGTYILHISQGKEIYNSKVQLLGN